MDYFDEFTYEAKPKLPSFGCDLLIIFELIKLLLKNLHIFNIVYTFFYISNRNIDIIYMSKYSENIYNLTIYNLYPLLIKPNILKQK